MSMAIMEQSGHTTYGLKTYVLDTPEDMDNLPVDDPMGSAAFVISTGAVYMLNSNGEWKEV